MFQRFDCAVRFGMITRGQDGFNLLFWLITREKCVFHERTQPEIGYRYPILNGPGNNGTMITPAENLMGVEVSLHVLRHRGQVDVQQVIAHALAISTVVLYYARG